jgi:hypothetical protein
MEEPQKWIPHIVKVMDALVCFSMCIMYDSHLMCQSERQFSHLATFCTVLKYWSIGLRIAPVSIPFFAEIFCCGNVQVFTDIVGTSTVDDECMRRIRAILAGIQQSMPEIFNMAIGALSDSDKGKLSQFMHA